MRNLSLPTPRSSVHQKSCSKPTITNIYRYNEYYKCKGQKGEDNEECEVYKRAALSMCPMDWIEKWEDLREEGNWPGKY